MPSILVLGGHGKVALRLTKILAAQNHVVTSIIRNQDHAQEIQQLAPPQNPSLVKPVVASIEESDDEAARKLMEGIDWVVWSAGAGGKGGAERTKAVDEHAAKKFMRAALDAPTVKKFLMVSASCARRSPASYWDEEDIATYKKAWQMIPVYCEAKTNADEYLFEESRKTKKPDWEDIHLRPGALTDEPGTGKISLGRARQAGSITREDVAAAAAELLQRGNVGGLWLDLIQGEDSVSTAVEKVVTQQITAKE
ncbi:NAD(P)-binding protein [Dendrothele bispora CBS 962.96]|uniref:NAD(P)-binding protein n=1 Tax=Dendrothele bispora (strain CBS 962.96) TaxID=1314807 RepID=A0A4S8MY37_DENBC|nr:NAD(P)-binding protein [Dendrothele bispora CBS 962.96]